MTGKYYAIKNSVHYVIHLSYKCIETGKYKKKSVTTDIPIVEGELSPTAQKKLDRQMYTLIDKAIAKYEYLEKPRTAEDILFSEWLLSWVDHHEAEKEITTATAEGYREYFIKNHLNVYFEGKKLNEITVDSIKQYMSDKQKDGGARNGGALAYDSIKKHFAVIKQALRWAKEKRLIADNPADYIRLHATEMKEIQVLTAEEIKILLAAVKASNLNLQAVTALATLGLSRSEAIGMKWGALDLKNTKFRVEHTVTKVKTIHEQDDVKAKDRKRKLVMSEELKNLFLQIEKQKQERKKFFGRGYEYNDYVFCTSTGHRVDPDNIGKEFTSLVKKLDIPYVTLHGLRHYVHITEERKKAMTEDYLAQIAT